MSRQLDPSALDEQDVAYIRDRPFIQREFIMQGFGDPLSRDYDGLTFEYPEEDEADASDDTGDATEDTTEDPGYEDWKNKRLEQEISDRNADREDDDKIVPEGDNKAAMALALREDDKVQAEKSEETE